MTLMFQQNSQNQHSSQLQQYQFRLDKSLFESVLAVDYEQVDSLLSRGANPNRLFSQHDGMASFHLAVGVDGDYAHLLTRLFIKHNADVNLKSKRQGWTPSHVCSYWNKPKSLGILLDNRADISILDNDNNSPLDIAREAHSDECIQLIEAHLMAQMSCANRDGDLVYCISRSLSAMSLLSEDLTVAANNTSLVSSYSHVKTSTFNESKMATYMNVTLAKDVEHKATTTTTQVNDNIETADEDCDDDEEDDDDERDVTVLQLKQQQQQRRSQLQCDARINNNNNKNIIDLISSDESTFTQVTPAIATPNKQTVIESDTESVCTFKTASSEIYVAAVKSPQSTAAAKQASKVKSPTPPKATTNKTTVGGSSSRSSGRLLPETNNNNNKGYSAPLLDELADKLETTCTSDIMEARMFTCFKASNIDASSQKEWREGVQKSAFNYVLIDPRITANLPVRVKQQTSSAHHHHKPMSANETFATFVSAIFYIGKGSRARPYCHLYDSLKAWKAAVDAPSSDNVEPIKSKKIARIVEIWRAGLGIVSLHCFQSVIPTEAYTREAAMIDAIGMSNLTNMKRGNYYGEAKSWSERRKCELGTILLRRACAIFLAEGERQITPADL